MSHLDDAKLRLECLKLAVGTGDGPDTDPIGTAREYADFVLGTALSQPSPRHRVVQISVPLLPEKGRSHRILLLNDKGGMDEGYLAGTAPCALAVANCLLHGEAVPHDYFMYLDGVFPSPPAS